jgi:hypothetical protein
LSADVLYFVLHDCVAHSTFDAGGDDHHPRDDPLAIPEAAKMIEPLLPR